jgi:hypothetical protein
MLMMKLMTTVIHLLIAALVGEAFEFADVAEKAIVEFYSGLSRAL